MGKKKGKSQKEKEPVVELTVCEELKARYCPAVKLISPRLLEDIDDLAKTLARVFSVCNIPEGKAELSVNTVRAAFFVVDDVCARDKLLLMQLRKKAILHDLGVESLMNQRESYLAYKIIKRVFNLYYFENRPRTVKEEKLAEQLAKECGRKKSCINLKTYMHVAERIAQSFARCMCVPCEVVDEAEWKIKLAFKRFYERMVVRHCLPIDSFCSCCECYRKRLQGIPFPSIVPACHTPIHIIDEQSDECPEDEEEAPPEEAPAPPAETQETKDKKGKK